MSSPRDFQDSLAFGHVGESLVSSWLLRQGHTVIPIGSPNYTLHSHQGGAPVAYKDDRAIVCPDLLCRTTDGIKWVEVKQKSRFAWYRRGQCWNTGIDDRLWTHYRDCQRVTGVPVWLLFLHRESTPSPGDQRYLPPGTLCPVGLFGIDLFRADECKRSGRDGNRTMWYWRARDLKLLATLEEVLG